MWRCNSCGTENKSDSSFCKNCGSPKPKRDKTKYFLLAIIGILSVALVFSTFAIIRLVSSSKVAPPPAPTKNTTYIQSALHTPEPTATPYSGNGSWVSITYNGENYQGYQMSSSTAYNFGDDNKVWFIESEDYYTTTEYRYRDYIMVS